MESARVRVSGLTRILQVIFDLLWASVSKEVFVQSLSRENEFDLHENEPVRPGKFSKFGELLSLIDGSAFSFLLRGIHQCLFISTGGRMAFYFGKFLQSVRTSCPLLTSHFAI